MSASSSFEMGPIRPPSEGRDCSLLVRVTRNCPWNRCEFCNSYKGQRFGYRGPAQVMADIDCMKTIADGLRALSWQSGYGGTVNDMIVAGYMRDHPELYGRDSQPSGELHVRYHSLTSVANWLQAGARTVFLQDADSPIMRTAELLDVLRHLKSSFPSLERVTSYARSKSLSRKSVEELRALREAGLSRLHVGLESGCNEVLAFIQKGATAEDHVNAGQKVLAACMELSEYVIPGLGGRRWSEKHALETAAVLNRIGPHFIRLRSLIVRPGTPLRLKLENGEFQELTEDQVVAEIRTMIEHLECHSYLASDQMSNLLLEVEGRLPEDKAAMLATIGRYQAMPVAQRLKFRLGRRVRSYLGVYGVLTRELDDGVKEAMAAVDEGTAGAEARVDAVISALKDRFV